MRKGEKGILVGIGAFALAAMAWKAVEVSQTTDQDYEIPYYSTASSEVEHKAGMLIKQQGCKDCHTLWATRNVMRNVPSPRLDGIGSIRDEDWLYRYLSAEDPQSILPSRLKDEYEMPSYADLPEQDRQVLAKYLSSLKVKDWYLEETRRSEYEKLTGKKYQP